MLKLINSMAELNTEQLMAVYFGGNLEKGQYRHPDLSEAEQLRRAEDAFLSYLREDFFRRKSAVYAVWSVADTYLSVLRWEPYDDGVLIEALETAPNARRQGFAFSLMSAVIAHLRSSGCIAIYSHINKHNVASIAIHTRCGFHKISDTARLLDGTVTHKYCTMCCKLQ